MNDIKNRMWTAENPSQGSAKRVLCVCSAGILRSPTAAIVLANEFGYNTRACGITRSHALIPISPVLIHWAEEIVCMDENQELALIDLGAKNIINLGIPDVYDYMDPDLGGLIVESYNSVKEYNARMGEPSNEAEIVVERNRGPVVPSLWSID